MFVASILFHFDNSTKDSFSSFGFQAGSSCIHDTLTSYLLTFSLMKEAWTKASQILESCYWAGWNSKSWLWRRSSSTPNVTRPQSWLTFWGSHQWASGLAWRFDFLDKVCVFCEEFSSRVIGKLFCFRFSKSGASDAVNLETEK